MIKKIICPVDFSKAANNAVPYAAKIAQAFSAELVLFNANPEPIVEFVFLEKDSYDNVLQSSYEALKVMCDSIEKAYHIICVAKLNTERESVGALLRQTIDPDTMIVMGTNGADTIYQEITGSFSFKLSAVLPIPVWIVPQNTEYATIKNIVFAWKDEKDNDSLSWLLPIVQTFSCNITFLHVNPYGYNEDKLLALKKSIEKGFPKATTVKFEHIPSDKKAESIFTYVERNKPNLLVLGHHHEQSWDSFKANVTKDLTGNSETPLLIVP